MSRYSKIRAEIMSGKSDKNISENDMYYFLERIGAYHKRTTGSHQIYSMDNIREIINLQPQDGKIKPYEVKQVRNLVNKYKLGKEDN